jgi:hypothetical protein
MEPPRSPQLARRGGAAGADVPEAEGGRRPRRWSQAASTEGAKPLRDNGRGGIRTHDTVFAVYTLSRRPGARPDSGIVTDFHRAEGSIRRPSAVPMPDLGLPNWHQNGHQGRARVRAIGGVNRRRPAQSQYQLVRLLTRRSSRALPAIWKALDAADGALYSPQLPDGGNVRSLAGSRT